MKPVFIIFMVLGLGSATLDLKRSINRIQEQIEKTRTNPADWTKLPVIIGMAIPCLVNGIEIGLFEVESGRLPSSLKEYIENVTPMSFAESLLKVKWDEISTNGSNVHDIMDDWKEYMKTPEFEKVHSHIWSNDEFKDLIGYLHDANYVDIYESIKAFYIAMEREDLVGDLPTAPPVYPPIQATKKVGTQSAPKATSNNFPIITMKSAIFKTVQEDTKCDLTYLLQILTVLNASNIHEIIKIFLYIFQEFVGNAAMHVLMMKVGEPQKGEFFHSTLALPEMAGFFPLVQGTILQEPGFNQLNSILRQVTGLDLENPRLFKYITDLIQYLVWNYPFPEA